MLVPNQNYYPQQLAYQGIPQKLPTNVIAANTAGQQIPATFMAVPSPELMKAYYTPISTPANTVVASNNTKAQPKSVWATADAQKRQNINQMGESYKAFLNNAKTDLSAVNTMIQRAQTEGFQPWPNNNPNRLYQPGEKFYRVTRDRSLQLIVIGKEPITNGFKMVATHIDTPHISLKARPLQDAAGGFATFKTKVHGGIKPHQWTQRNLALVGKVIKKDGSTLNIDIGNKPGEPVFIIPELAPHVDNDQNLKKNLESLNPIVGSNEAYSLDTNAESDISSQVEQILKQNYGITKEDFEFAQLDLVPAENARDVGFDRSLISGYGSDNKTSAYAGMEAMIAATKFNPMPNKTMVLANFGNEEVGSWNSYGAKSDDTRMMMAEIMKYTTGQYDELALKQAFKNSLIVSADVTTGIDPVRPDAEEGTNAAVLGYGPAIAKEGAFTSTPEAAAYFSRMIGDVKTQTHTFNQDVGGGATLGNYLATQNNVDVIDIGVPVIGMHSPTEVISKADLYEFTTALLNYYSR